MTLLTDPLFVHLLVSAVAVIAVGCVTFSRKPFAPITALLILSFGMFAYTVVPFWNSNEPYFWYQTPPPQSVSRIILGATLVVCLMSAWRERYTKVKSQHFSLFIVFLIAIIFSSFFSFIFFPHLGIENLIVQLKFSIILCFYIGTSCIVGILAMPIQSQTKRLRAFCNTAIILGIASISVAAIEVGLDIGYIKNFFRGAIETRASSVFLNPNWFALCLATTAFLAAFATFEKQNKHSIVLFAICTSAIILSGSRSTLSVIVISFIALMICLGMIGRTGYKSLISIMQNAIIGITFGMTSLMTLFLCMGETAVSRYVSLLERVFLWPIYLSSDLSSQASIAGRISSPVVESQTSEIGSVDISNFAAAEVPIYGQGVVDNAYIYWLQRNPIGALLLIVFTLFILTISVRYFLKNKTPANALRVSAALYIMLSGTIGQVYWAFPVWIPLSILTAFIFATQQRSRSINRKFLA